jgi:hypothetical protein
MKFSRTIIGLLAVTGFAVAASSSSLAAKSRPSGIASLSEMGCQKTSGNGGYKSAVKDLTVGREIFRTAAFIGEAETGMRPGISSREPTAIVCRLAPVKGSPQFKTLNLTVGFDQGDRRLNGSVVVRLSIYKDGNFYKEETINRGELVRLPVDIDGVRSLALEAECVRANDRYGSCPNLWVLEDILRK